MSAKQSEKKVATKLTGSENVQQAVEVLTKNYGVTKTLQMLSRGEYDVLYREGRSEVTSEARKQAKERLRKLEELAAKHGWLETEKKKVQ